MAIIFSVSFYYMFSSSFLQRQKPIYMHQNNESFMIYSYHSDPKPYIQVKQLIMIKLFDDPNYLLWSEHFHIIGTNSTLLLFLQDPCTSFYAFSCGGWMSRNPPPPRRMVHSVMSEMRDKIDLKLKGTKIQIEISFYYSIFDVPLYFNFNKNLEFYLVLLLRV